MSIYKIFSIALCLSLATQLQAADWRACEKAKLRQLKLEHAAHGGGGGKKSGSSKSSKKRQDVGQLDEWLWKNCREYANELRTLEQERM